jgi:hypothetical protein
LPLRLDLVVVEGVIVKLPPSPSLSSRSSSVSDESSSTSSGTEEKELLMLELLTYELVLFVNMAGISEIITNG